MTFAKEMIRYLDTSVVLTSNAYYFSFLYRSKYGLSSILLLSKLNVTSAKVVVGIDIYPVFLTALYSLIVLYTIGLCEYCSIRPYSRIANVGSLRISQSPNIHSCSVYFYFS